MMTFTASHRKQLYRLAGVLLLLLFFARLLSAAAVKSATFDETLHVFQGALYWSNGQLYSAVQNPPLVNALLGLPVRLFFAPAIPEGIQPVSDWLGVSRNFMWALNPDGLQLLWVGRVVIMWLALLLGALVFRWTRALSRSAGAALLALGLFTFDPNILAHSYLATTDLGITFFMFLAAFLAYRYWRVTGAARRGPYLLVGAALGAACAAKFSGLILLPALLLIGVYRAATQPPPRHWRRTLLEIAGWLLIGTLVFGLLYRFDWQTFLLDFNWQREHQLTGRDSFFLGEYTRGTLLYFPVVFLLKTPLPLLLLFGMATVAFLARGLPRWTRLWPLLVAGGVGAAALVSTVNQGYRYLLPALPFLFVFTATELWPLLETSSRRLRTGARLALGGLVAALAVASLAAHPHYLAYFNTLAGGPDNGWRLVVDSNIDWGQDVQALGAYMQAQNIESVNASWLGSAPLSAYDIPGRVIAGWPGPRIDPLYDAFYPPVPAPGFYALSVTQLQGVYLDEDRERFVWFRERTPTAKAGYSLFLYDVPASGPPVGLALSGIGLADIPGAVYTATFGTNAVRPAWFDARTSFLWPGGGVVEVGSVPWVAIGDGHRPDDPALVRLRTSATTAQRASDPTDPLDFTLYALPDPPSPPVPNESGEALFGQTYAYLGTDFPAGRTVRAGEPVSLLSYWRVAQAPDEQVKLFVHLLDGAGNLVAQHDGLDVLTPGLQVGDVFVQRHMLQLPADLPEGEYALQIGVYAADSLVRLPLAGGELPDRLHFASLTVAE